MPQRPPRPPEVELQLRQEAGFGCCKCGAGIIEYHHIIEWNEIQHYNPEHMMVLCPSCHHVVGAKSREDQYEIKADPKNIRDGLPYGELVVRRGQKRTIDLGSNVIAPRGRAPLLVIDGVSVLSAGFDQHGMVHLWLRLYDESNRLLAEIIDNEWIAIGNLLWDVIPKNRSLKIRQRERRILLEIDLRKEVPFIQGLFWRCGTRIWIKHSSIRIGAFEISDCMVTGGGIGATSLPDGRYAVSIGQVKFDISEDYSKNVNPLDETFYRKHVSLPQFCNIQGPVQNKVFKECLIDGPSVIYPQPTELQPVKFEHCTFYTAEPGDDVFIEVPADKRFFGINFFIGCQFEGCVFRAINIAGTANQIELFRRSIRGEN